MAVEQTTVYVHEHWTQSDPQQMGKLYVSHGKGSSVFSFAYDQSWLKEHSLRSMLDPDLQLYGGRQYTNDGKGLFGVFMDSCPDRWGRMLMQRRENIRARKEDRKARALTDLDYLLGVYDVSRMGALRFSLEPDGPFLSDDKELSTPPWVTLRALESASLAFEADEIGMQEKWLNMLIAPGSSLGGARPKATVQDPNGNLWIAKFPVNCKIKLNT